MKKAPIYYCHSFEDVEKGEEIRSRGHRNQICAYENCARELHRICGRKAPRKAPSKENPWFQNGNKRLLCPRWQEKLSPLRLSGCNAFLKAGSPCVLCNCL